MADGRASVAGGAVERATPDTRIRRPRAVSFVASLLLIEAALGMAAGAIGLTDDLGGLPGPLTAPGTLPAAWALAPELALSTVTLLTGAGSLLAGLGLLRMREWAWVLAMALQGLALATALYSHWQGEAQYAPLALGSFAVLVLNQREVRQAFRLQDGHVRR